MRRFYALIIILMVSTLACGFITTVTPVPTNTSIPTEAKLIRYIHALPPQCHHSIPCG
jgi:hypothetical protein